LAREPTRPQIILSRYLKPGPLTNDGCPTHPGFPVNQGLKYVTTIDFVIPTGVEGPAVSLSPFNK
jgi:hypothetical protein